MCVSLQQQLCVFVLQQGKKSVCERLFSQKRAHTWKRLKERRWALPGRLSFCERVRKIVRCVVHDGKKAGVGRQRRQGEEGDNLQNVWLWGGKLSQLKDSDHQKCMIGQRRKRDSEASLEAWVLLFVGRTWSDAVTRTMVVGCWFVTTGGFFILLEAADCLWNHFIKRRTDVIVSFHVINIIHLFFEILVFWSKEKQFGWAEMWNPKRFYTQTPKGINA